MEGTPYRSSSANGAVAEEEETDWLELWASWTTVLHRSPEEFWELTPREVSACFAAFRSHEQSQNARAGLIASAIYNCNLRTKKSDKVWTWRDFFEDAPGESTDSQSKFELAFQLEMTERKLKKKQGKLRLTDGSQRKD